MKNFPKIPQEIIDKIIVCADNCIDFPKNVPHTIEIFLFDDGDYNIEYKYTDVKETGEKKLIKINGKEVLASIYEYINEYILVYFHKKLTFEKHRVTGKRRLAIKKYALKLK